MLTRNAVREAADYSDQHATDALAPIAEAVSNIVPANTMIPQASSAFSEDPTQRNAGLLGALRAACSLANVIYSQTMSADDLLVEMLASRDPSILPQPSDSSYDQVQRRTGGSVSASNLSPSHNLSGSPITSDPFLEKLYQMRRNPCALGSVRQDIPSDDPSSFDNSKLYAVNTGDVVVYQEQGIPRSVMGLVIGMGSKRGRSNSTVIRIQVQRLYEFEELAGIIDNIATYRNTPKLKTIKFSNVPPPSDGDPDILRAHGQYLANKRQIKEYFRFPPDMVEKQAVLITIMSDHVAYLLPKHVHKVMHATLHPAILESIDSSLNADPEWPSKAEATKMLGGTTVMWHSFVNTKKWTLHRITLSEDNMIKQVFMPSGRAMYWASQAVTRGLAGIFRRYIRAAFKRIGSEDAQPRQCVLSVPCPFSFLAHLVDATRKPNNCLVDFPEDVDVTWNETRREWTATWARPDLMDIHLGHNWSCIQLGETSRIIQATGQVILRYRHDKPDKVNFTMSKVSCGVPGGLTAVLEPLPYAPPAQDVGY